MKTYKGEYRCPKCDTYNEAWKKREKTVGEDTVYCWHCGCKVRLKNKESKCKPNEVETTKKPPEAIYMGFNSHDCETQYKCPVCNRNFGGWSLPSGAKIAGCPCCGSELRF